MNPVASFNQLEYEGWVVPGGAVPVGVVSMMMVVQFWHTNINSSCRK